MKINKIKSKKVAAIALALLMGAGSFGQYSSFAEGGEKIYNETFRITRAFANGNVISGEYDAKLKISVKEGKVIEIRDDSTNAGGDAMFWNWALGDEFVNKFKNMSFTKENYIEQVDGINDKNNGTDVTTTATVSRRAIKEMVKSALKKHFDSSTVNPPAPDPGTTPEQPNPGPGTTPGGPGQGNTQTTQSKYKIEKFTVKIPKGADKDLIIANILNTNFAIAKGGKPLTQEEEQALEILNYRGREQEKNDKKKKLREEKVKVNADTLDLDSLNTNVIGKVKNPLNFKLTYGGEDIPVTIEAEVVEKYWIHIHAIEIPATPGLNVNTKEGKDKIIEFIQNTGSFQIRANATLSKDDAEKVKKANESALEEKIKLREIKDLKVIDSVDLTKPSKGNIEHALSFYVDLGGERIELREDVDVLVTKPADTDYKFEYDEAKETLSIGLSKNAKVGDYIAIGGYPRNIELNEEDIKAGYISIKAKKDTFRQRNGSYAVTIRNISDEGISGIIRVDIPTTDTFDKPEKKAVAPVRNDFSGVERVSYYVHEGSRFSYPIKLEVRTENGKIVSVKDDGTTLDDHNQRWMQMVYNKLGDLTGKSYDDVEKLSGKTWVSGATWSANGTLEAVKKAMIKSSEKPSTNVEKPPIKPATNLSLKPKENNQNKKEEKKDSSSVPRVAGRDRIETSVEISKKTFNKADTVIIVNGYKNSDALTAVPYAASINAPVLFTNANGVPKVVMDEISRLGAKNVVIIGGQLSVNDSVSAKELKDLKIERISGADRYETAKLIAEKFSKINVGKKSAIIVNSKTMVDALSIPSLDEKYQGVVLLTEASKLSDVSAKYINDSKIENVLILGGENSVSSSIEKSLNAINVQTTRIAGADRYETSRKITEMSSSKPEAVIASGENFADALSVGVYAKKNNAALLVTKDGTQLDATKKLIKNKGIKKATVVGGGASLSENVKSGIAEAIK